jgi:hypothetical protein
MHSNRPTPQILMHHFKNLPYENITKIFRLPLPPENRPRDFVTIFKDNKNLGAGGTCFSLTNSAVELFRQNHIPAWPIEGKMSRRSFPHYAFLCDFQGHYCFADPGYLIYESIPLPQNGASVEFSNGVIDYRIANLEQNLYALSQKNTDAYKEKYRFSASPVSDSIFRRHWLDSFEAMHEIVLSRLLTDRFVYIHGDFVQIRTRNSVWKMADREKARAALFEYFPFSPEQIAEAENLLSNHHNKRKSDNGY